MHQTLISLTAPASPSSPPSLPTLWTILTGPLCGPTSLQPQLCGHSPSSSTTTEPSPAQGPHFHRSHGTSIDQSLLSPCPSHHRVASFGGQVRPPDPHALLSTDTYKTLPPSPLPLSLHSNSQETSGSMLQPLDSCTIVSPGVLCLSPHQCPGRAHTGTLSSL